LAYIGRQLGKDPADVAWDIVLKAHPKRSMAMFFMMSEPDIEMALKFPWMSIGSDGYRTCRPSFSVDAGECPRPFVHHASNG
jgi:N-acyl-D-amino-acid deacylase